VSTVYRPGVTLLRQSRKKTDPKYNFYLQNNAPPDAVELAMIYDPAAPNAPDLMVTKQGGTLRALATPPAWHHANTPWGRTLRLDKTVSRPWVEWVGIQSISPLQGEESPSKGTESWALNQEGTITFESKRTFFRNKRHTAFNIAIRSDNGLIGTEPILITATNGTVSPTTITIGDSSIKVVNKALTLDTKGARSSALANDALIFKRSGKEIGRINITVYEPVMWDASAGIGLPENGSCYIGEEVVMPNVTASINPEVDTSVQWKLKITYAGYDAAACKLPTDDLFPTSGYVAQPASQAWNLKDWVCEVRGGGATLAYRLGDLPAEDVKYFIKGKNPGAGRSITFISQHAGWPVDERYVEAMAREESGGCYLQFNETAGTHGGACQYP
jgi:hypothetical protein